MHAHIHQKSRDVGLPPKNTDRLRLPQQKPNAYIKLLKIDTALFDAENQTLNLTSTMLKGFRMNRTYIKGLTLVELLVAIGIISVIGLLAPSPTRLIGQQQLYSSQNELRLLITRARSDALTLNTRITLCPLSTAKRCLNQWSATLTEFIDENGNRALDPNEEELYRIVIPSSIHLSWKGMNPANSLHFSPKGITFVSNGTFTMCNTLLPESLKLIINRQGRIRTERITQSCEASLTT